MTDIDIDRFLMAHLNRVKESVAQLDRKSAFAFAASCLERFARIYDRSLEAGKHPNLDPGRFRSALDLVWDWLEKDSGVDWSSVAASYREEAANEPVKTLETLGDSVLFLGVGVIADFLTTLQREEPEDAHFFAARNLELIESLVDDTEEIPGGGRALFEEEMKRQLDDLQRLEAAEIDERTLADLREESRGQDIWGGFEPA